MGDQGHEGILQEILREGAIATETDEKVVHTRAMLSDDLVNRQGLPPA
jgi:hypothetical protein